MLFSLAAKTVPRGSLLLCSVPRAAAAVRISRAAMTFSTNPKMAEGSSVEDATVDAVDAADLMEQGQAKLRAVLRQYYQSNFNRESTDAYFRNIVKQADWNNDGVVEYTELQRLLKRIGHTSAMTDGEIEGCIRAFGGSVDQAVPVNQLLKLLLDPEKGYAASLPNNADHPLHPLGRDDDRAKTAAATF
jgi:hypothetical protein